MTISTMETLITENALFLKEHRYALKYNPVFLRHIYFTYRSNDTTSIL